MGWDGVSLGGGTGGVLVCTPGAAFEMDWWWFGFFSVDTILHTFPSASACIACTDMVYLKALACDVTTTAILRLKTLAFILS